MKSFFLSFSVNVLSNTLYKCVLCPTLSVKTPPGTRHQTVALQRRILQQPRPPAGPSSAPPPSAPFHITLTTGTGHNILESASAWPFSMASIFFGGCNILLSSQALHIVRFQTSALRWITCRSCLFTNYLPIKLVGCRRCTAFHRF